MNSKPVAVIAHEDAYLSKTLNCLRIAGIDSIVYDPNTPINISKELLSNCDYIIVKGHSSDFRLMIKLKKICQARIINHWLGSDVYNTFGNVNRFFRIYLAQQFISQNWVVGKRLVGPLKKIGISSKVIPHRIFIEKKKLPKELVRGVLVYNPTITARTMDPIDLYGIDKAAELSAKLPNYTFYLVGGGKIPEGFSSCLSYGYLPGLDSLWSKVSFYFRVTRSDGMPGIILEAAENGVLSISDYQYFNGIIKYTNSDDVADQINSFSEQVYQDSLDIMIKEIKQVYSEASVVTAYRDSLGYSNR